MVIVAGMEAIAGMAIMEATIIMEVIADMEAVIMAAVDIAVADIMADGIIDGFLPKIRLMKGGEQK